MLDLTKINAPLYAIKLEDGKVLKIKKPSQGLMMRAMQMQDVDTEAPETIEAIYDILHKILNNNTQGVDITMERVEAYDIDTVALILTDYLNFVAEELGE